MGHSRVLSLLARRRRLGRGFLSEARERRDDLQRALAAIYKSAPHTTPRAYAKAQAALQLHEDYTFNDGEIDKFLPPALKRG